MPQGNRDLDRELMELLNELRVTLPGVQVLFAFMLTVPFTERFRALTAVQRDVYFGAFVATAAATVCLLAAPAFHRLRFRRFDKDVLLRYANRMAIVGLTLLGLALGAVVFVVTDLLFTRPAAVAAAALVALAIGAFWFAYPLSREVADDAPS